MQLGFRSKDAAIHHNNIQNPNFRKGESLTEKRSSWFKRTINSILLGAGLATCFTSSSQSQRRCQAPV